MTIPAPVPQETDGREEFMIGNLRVTLLPHNLPLVGPRLFVHLDEPGTSSIINLTPQGARLFAARLQIGACEAEHRAKRQQRLHAISKPAATPAAPAPAANPSDLTIFERQQAD